MLFDGRIEHNPINLGDLPAKMLVVYFFLSRVGLILIVMEL